MLLALTFGAGYFTKGQFVLADEAKQTRVVIKDTAKGIVKSVQDNQRIETAVTKTNTAVNDIKKTVAKRGVTITTNYQEKCHVVVTNDGESAKPENAELAHVSGDAHFLDRGTVSLLNAARQNFSVDSVGSLDETERAASTVEVADLVESDLEITRMYLELAKRHDELVDSVEQKLKQQAQ
ncbi:MAG: hypothetical protein WKG03_06950 [Telluria sp.]